MRGFDLPSDVPLDWLPFSGQTLGAVLLLAAGMLYCFLGYRTLKFVIGLSGFLLAGATAAVLAEIFAPENVLYLILAVVLGGLCGACALLFLYRAGVFVLGAVGVFLVAQAMLGDRTESWAPWAVLAAGLGGGVTALVLERILMTFATAAIGSWLLVGAAAVLLDDTSLFGPVERLPGFPQHKGLLLAVWVFLTIAGATAQFAAYRRPEPPRPGHAQ